MKITVKKAIELLSQNDSESEILFWFRTSGDMDATDDEWKKIYDDSQGLEENIDEYVNGWLEEVREEE